MIDGYQRVGKAFYTGLRRQLQSRPTNTGIWIFEFTYDSFQGSFYGK